MLTPNRALTPRGARIVVLVAACFAAVPGVVFYLLGAWPVVGLMGLDVLVLWLALKLAMKAGDAFEEVTLWPDRLEIRTVGAFGREQRRAELNPFFARLVVDHDREGRVSRLAIRAREQHLEIARFLNADDKESFAKALGSALRAARG